MMLQDLRYGLRLLSGAPGFSAIAIGALAIGIGANTAIFSVLNTLLIQKLPYHEADRLAVVWEHNLPRDRRNNVVSPGNFIHWREMNQVFEDIAAVGMTFNTVLTGVGEPEELPMQFVSAQFFPILGVQPLIGRTFTAEEDRPRSRFAVISHRIWTRRFNSDRSVLERPVTFDGNPHTVVGVMPPGFSFLDKTVDVWLPVGFSAQSRTPRGRWLQVVGRLKPGMTFERAQGDMARVAGTLTQMFPDFNTGWTARVVPLREQLTGNVRSPLLVLAGAVTFVLLIACADVANLLLARATARQRELAVRAALGAGRARLVRQLLAESVILALAGGVGGLLLAQWALTFLRAVVAERLPIQRLEVVGIDGWVLLFTLVASLLSGVVFGVVPALTAAGTGLNESLKEGGRTGSGARGRRTRAVFVIVEVALALVLLVGAGLLMRSFLRLVEVNPGFDSTRTLTMRISLPPARYRSDGDMAQFFNRLFQQVDALPGVHASGAVSFLPLTGLASATSLEIIGQPKPPRGQDHVADVRVVTHDYFKAMGVPLLKGRLFDAREAAASTDRVIVNEALAKKHWPGEDPIGKRLQLSWSNPRPDEVIGVVGDIRHYNLDTEARPMTYWSYLRSPYSALTIAIRARGDANLVANSVIAIVRDLDPALAVANVRTMDEVVSNSVAERRVTMMLLSMFAGAALVLAAIGIYGVIAYGVTQRTQEIGLRMALGAQRSDVLRMVVKQAVALVLVGIVLGGAFALLLTRLMKGMLFQVAPSDPGTFAAVSGLLAAVAVLASSLPGLRATRVDPVIALRAE